MTAMLLAMLVNFGDAPFCVVSASGSRCFYYSVQSCQAAAQSSGGMCVANPSAMR